MIDKFTRERSRVQFARVLVEMDITDNPPRSIQFLNEYGQIVDQGVDYEWLPIKCKVCSGYGHSMVDFSNISTDAEGPNNSEASWKTPKKVATLSKQGLVEVVSSLSAKIPTGQGQNQKNAFEVLQEQVDGEKGDFYSSSVTECRILVIWRKTFVRVTIIEETNQYVHCVVKLAGQRHAFCATFVYGLNTMEGRKRLWQGLPRLNLPVKSWIILGDFNAIFTGKDRNGGKLVSKMELTDSAQWLAGNQVELLKSTESYFAWTNNQDGPARIYSKIDHVFTNEDWLDVFPSSIAVFRWEVVSDHCSCVISTTTMENMGIKLFQFYNFWTEHQDFKEVVLNSWRKPINGTGLRAIYLKTMRLKHRLKRFNRDNIGDIGLNY
ncbi:uncharacterized protein LOC133784898 [Humulus lupulus]|uniref:uncharacterized protein LOC133784898 n=1 Tax=Humulus lupulus TaxID=3486 RepID=UPI002B407201|nr:uncharacterized protein LOC133784898 [Humulus lupulus]